MEMDGAARARLPAPVCNPSKAMMRKRPITWSCGRPPRYVAQSDRVKRIAAGIGPRDWRRLLRGQSLEHGLPVRRRRRRKGGPRLCWNRLHSPFRSDGKVVKSVNKRFEYHTGRLHDEGPREAKLYAGGELVTLIWARKGRNGANGMSRHRRESCEGSSEGVWERPRFKMPRRPVLCWPSSIQKQGRPIPNHR